MGETRSRPPDSAAGGGCPRCVTGTKPMIWGKGYRRVGMWLGRVRGGGGCPRCVTGTKPNI